MQIDRLKFRNYFIPVMCIWVINFALLMFFSDNNNDVYTYYISFAIILTYILALILSIRKFGTVSLQSLFLACLFLFNYGRIFLYVLGLFDYTNAPYSWVGTFQWHNETIIKVDNYYLIFNTVFIFSLLVSKPSQLFHKQARNKVNINQVMTSEYIRKTFTVLFYVALPVIAYSMLRFSIIIMTSGYGSLYTGALQNYSGNFLLRISRLVFNTSFYVICMAEQDEKRFTKVGILYVFVTGIQIIQGVRGLFIVALLTVLYIRYRRFGKKVRIRTAILFVLLFIPSIYLIALFRDNALSSFDIRTSVSYFLADMSGSLNVPAYYLQSKNELIHNRVPFILEPIVRIFEVVAHPLVYSGGQSMEYINVTSNLGHILTYNISSTYYLAGNNIASNFIAEMSEFGIIGVFLGSSVFSYMLYVFDKMYDSNTFFRFMSCEFLLKLLYAPRGEMFYDSYSLLKYLLIYLCIYAFGSIANRKLP